MLFENKTAFITGAGRGFGAAFAERILREGGSVALIDLDGSALEQAAARLNGIAPRVSTHVCDVCDEPGLARAAAEIAARFGHIDVVINNAALHLMEYSQPCLQLDRAKWRRMMDVNVTALLSCTEACLPYMDRERGGVVLNMSSMASVPVHGAYGVSKMAVRALTVALAKELGPQNVRVVAIAPGFMDTEAAMNGVPPEFAAQIIAGQAVARQGRVEDIVNAMAYLCSDQGSFITGETLLVAGGAQYRV